MVVLVVVCFRRVLLLNSETIWDYKGFLSLHSAYFETLEHSFVYNIEVFCLFLAYFKGIRPFQVFGALYFFHVYNTQGFLPISGLLQRFQAFLTQFFSNLKYPRLFVSFGPIQRYQAILGFWTTLFLSCLQYSRLFVYFGLLQTCQANFTLLFRTCKASFTKFLRLLCLFPTYYRIQK